MSSSGAAGGPGSGPREGGRPVARGRWAVFLALRRGDSQPARDWPAAGALCPLGLAGTGGLLLAPDVPSLGEETLMEECLLAWHQ